MFPRTWLENIFKSSSCLVNYTYIYETPKTEGMHYTIIDEDGTARVIKLYHRLFGLAEITEMLKDNHFQIEEVYKNLKGDAVSKNSVTYGIIARKV